MSIKPIDREMLKEAARIVSKWPISRQAMLGPPPGPFRRFCSKEPEMLRMKRLAVLLSGSGTTLENIFDHCRPGEIHAKVEVVVSSDPEAYGLVRAARRGVPTATVVRKNFEDFRTFSTAVFDAIDRHGGADLVVLAGFLRRVLIPEKYRGKVVNVHPSLIPMFCGKGWHGKRVHAAVIKRGCKVTGCTVHLCDDLYDHGPILMQKVVEVLPDDTPESLAERVQKAEREIYPKAIQKLLSKGPGDAGKK